MGQVVEFGAAGRDADEGRAGPAEGPVRSDQSGGELWRRRQAAQLLVQLPDDERAALDVLDFCRLMVRFVHRA